MILLLIPLSLILVVLALWGVFWTVRMVGIDALACGLMRPTRSGCDQQLMLRCGPDGRLHGDFAPLTERGWIVQAGTQDWRLVGSLDLALSATLELFPQAVPPGF